MKVSIANPTNIKLPQINFEAISNAILGDTYELALTIITSAEIQKLNLIYRNLNKPTDILSFPLSKVEGEIYICPEETKKEAKKFERTYENFFAFLFIHGCAHLKGLDHGGTMEKLEEKYRRQFGV